jgi:hypothetical protein
VGEEPIPFMVIMSIPSNNRSFLLQKHQYPTSWSKSPELLVKFCQHTIFFVVLTPVTLQRFVSTLVIFVTGQGFGVV